LADEAWRGVHITRQPYTLLDLIEVAADSDVQNREHAEQRATSRVCAFGDAHLRTDFAI
jgi:hypothetical protein